MQEIPVNRIVSLLLAQQKGTITTQEQQELDGWIHASESNQQFAERCLDQAQVAASLEQMEAIDAGIAWQQFMEKNRLKQVPEVPFRKKPWRWIAAAIIAGILSFSVYFWLHRTGQKHEQELVTTNKGGNIQPGTHQATLTLSDGHTILLADARDGTLAKEGGITVHKQGNELIYNTEKHTEKANENASVLYNTVTTPRGGNYALTLPDKTKVWLNAEASIRYPMAFTGNERKVEMAGEAYFEVTKKTGQPFVVAVNNVQVKVLGTHFNIKAYADEMATKTTLLEGSVQVSATGQFETAKPEFTTVLKPGQQASIPLLSQSGQSLKIPVQTVDTESIIAWKNGYFDFKATPLADIMKEAKRWYGDVEAIDLKEPITDRFTATIPRNVPLSTLLTILEETGRVHFEVRGKTIVVAK